jgi:hypothetical protein
MRHPTGRDAAERARRGVTPDAAEACAQHRRDVVLVHRKEGAIDVHLLFDEEPDHRRCRRHAPRARQLIDAHPDDARVAFAADVGDEDRLPTVAAENRITRQVDGKGRRRCERGLAQPLERRIVAAVAHLRRQDRREFRPRRDVRIRVARYRMTLLQRTVEHRERAVHLAPVAASRGLVVRTLHRDVGRFADRERLGDCLLERVTFVANVGDVAWRTCRARRRRAGDEFSAIGVPAGLVDETARHAERAFIDGIAHEQRLRCGLISVECPRSIAGDAAARGSESDQGGNVERDAPGFDEREEGVERRHATSSA